MAKGYDMNGDKKTMSFQCDACNVPDRCILVVISGFEKDKPSYCPFTGGKFDAGKTWERV